MRDKIEAAIEDATKGTVTEIVNGTIQKVYTLGHDKQKEGTNTKLKMVERPAIDIVNAGHIDYILSAL